MHAAGFAAAGGGGAPETLVLVAKALLFITAGVAASRWLARPLDRLLDRLSLEFFLLAVFGFLVATAALAEELGLSEAIGALMAGIVLSETSIRDQIEERFFSFRDIFAALFFFVFGLSIDVSAFGDLPFFDALSVWARSYRDAFATHPGTVAVFATIGTWAVAKHGLGRGEKDD